MKVHTPLRKYILTNATVVPKNIGPNIGIDAATVPCTEDTTVRLQLQRVQESKFQNCVEMFFFLLRSTCRRERWNHKSEILHIFDFQTMCTGKVNQMSKILHEPGSLRTPRINEFVPEAPRIKFATASQTRAKTNTCKAKAGPEAA